MCSCSVAVEWCLNRSACIAMLVLSQLVGEMLLATAALNAVNWRPLVLYLGVPFTTGLLFFYVLKESPKWLLACDLHNDLYLVLKFCARMNKQNLEVGENFCYFF